MDSLPRSSRRVALIGFVSLVVGIGLGRFAFTPLLPIMQEDRAINVVLGGMLASAHFFGYLLGAAVATALPFSPKTTFRVSLLAVGLSVLGMGLTGDPILWMALRWLAGVGSAFLLVIASNFFVRALADMGWREGQGWVFSGVGAGIVLAGLGAQVAMTLHAGSALTWVVFGIVALMFGLVAVVGAGPELAKTALVSKGMEPVHAPLDWTVIIAYGTAGMGYSIPATYLPVMASAIAPSAAIFGWNWPIFGTAAFLSTLIGGKLRKKVADRRLWALSQLVMAIGLVLPAFYSQVVAIMLAGVFVGGTFMIVTMAGVKEVHRTVPPTDAMRHIAAITVAFSLGQMIGPLAAGLIYGWTRSFTPSLLIIGLVLAATALPLLMESRKKEVVAREALPQ